jgi:hypothetical protein
MTEQQPEDASAQPTTDPEADDAQKSGADQKSGEDLDEGGPGDIGDAQLPEDLQPTEDNPLARHPGQSGDDDDQIGADREEDPQTAPLTEDDADYGSGGDDNDQSN